MALGLWMSLRETCGLPAVPCWVLSPFPSKNKDRKENIVECRSHFRLTTVNRRQAEEEMEKEEEHEEYGRGAREGEGGSGGGEEETVVIVIKRWMTWGS